MRIEGSLKLLPVPGLINRLRESPSKPRSEELTIEAPYRRPFLFFALTPLPYHSLPLFDRFGVFCGVDRLS